MSQPQQQIHLPHEVNHRKENNSQNLDSLDTPQDKGGTTHQIEIVSLNEHSQATSPKQRGAKQGGFVGAHQSSHQAEQDMLLKPLPLLDFSVPMEQEPQLLKAFKRNLLQARLRRHNDIENQCPHLKVDNWVCQECNSKVSSFGCIFDSLKGKVRTFMKVVYENDFLEDFVNSNGENGNEEEDENLNQGAGQQDSNREDCNGQSESLKVGQTTADILYQQYQPSNVTELREYMLFTICKKLKREFKRQQAPSLLGPGHVNHLSNKLISYLQENQKQKKKLLQKYNNDVLLFDSIFESGNLLQAETLNPTEYQLYMQVDTNTRGHQQWFYFRVRNTKRNKRYVFRIMNFTKQGLQTFDRGNAGQTVGASNKGDNGTGIQGNPQGQNEATKGKKGDHLQKIHYKSKLSEDSEWRVIDSDQIEFVRTSVQRKRKDILAAAADSDQDENEGDMDLIEQQLNSAKYLKQKSPKKRKAQYYYALQFEVQFTHSNDSVYFAYALPYTLSEMTEKILKKENQLKQSALHEEELKQQQENNSGDGGTPRLDEGNQRPPIQGQASHNSHGPGSKPPQAQAAQGGTPLWQENGATVEIPTRGIFYKREVMARSICGLPLYVITISKDSKNYKKKPIIIITSRVHAAETPSSYVFDGIYNFLTSNSSEAKFLRKFYTFVLVPTLNPDGVVCGNYRSSISGVDLNRQWIQPDEDYQPEIYSIKQLMKVFYEKERRQMWIYCDLHGHSKKKNSFFYGCNTAANGGFLSWTIVRLLPRIFAQKTHLFNYKDCRFKVEPYKFGTGRIVAWKQFQITHSFTLESSFYGYDFGEEQHKLFTEKEYSDVGMKLCSSIFELHFLWKSIRNELKLTNGWLKPRKLLEITGVPAAQLLSEEILKKKKENLKKKAIEQYEQFLKKYYNKTDLAPSMSGNKEPIPLNQIKRGSTIIPQLQNREHLSKDNLVLQKPKLNQNNGTSSINGVRVKAVGNGDQTAPVKSRNKGELSFGGVEGQSSENFKSSSKIDSKVSNTNGESEDWLYKLLIGLVKIQALIRGYLTRKKIQFKPIIVRVVDPSTRQNDRNLEVGPQDEAFSVSLLRNSNLRSLRQATLTEKLQHGEKPEEANGVNWREYFKDEELDDAYLHVEVQKEDDPDEDLTDGSSSNPSQDNFDLQEMYEQIYQVSNAQELAQRKEEANNRFMIELNDQDFMDGQAMFQLIDDTLEGRKQAALPGRQSFKGAIGRGQTKTKSFKIGDSAGKGSNNQISPDKQTVNRRPSFLEQQNLRKPDNLNLVHLSQQDGDMSMHPLTAHQIIDPNKMDKNQISQSRMQTGYGNKGGQPNSNQVFGGIAQHISQMQFKLFNQSHSNGFGVGGGLQYGGKKESIQQVIKDCFITKKIGNSKQPQKHHQPNFFGIGNADSTYYDGNRVHSTNYRHVGQNTAQQIKRQQQVQQQRRPPPQNIVQRNPTQKLNEQREQIKQYFNPGVPVPVTNFPLSGNQKLRSPMIAGSTKITSDDQYQNLYYPQLQDLAGGPPGSAVSQGIAADSQSVTYYGSHNYGMPNQSQQLQMMNQSNSLQSTGNPQQDQVAAAASSLFMKYVKSKIVKKIRTEQIPQQIADKYIDIYKELIDKEAQRKQEEQDFLKRQRGVYGHAIPMKPNSYVPYINGATVPQGASNNHNSVTSRNKNQAKSDHKSRQHKQKPAAGNPQHQTTRKDQYDQQSFNSHFGGQNQHQFEDLAVIAANLHDLHYSNQLQVNFDKDVIVRSSLDGETFINMKQNNGKTQQPQASNSVMKSEKGAVSYGVTAPNHNGAQNGSNSAHRALYAIGNPSISADLDPSQIHLMKQNQLKGGVGLGYYQAVPISNSSGGVIQGSTEQIGLYQQFSQQNNVKLPMINNFSSTINYHKRSHGIDEPGSITTGQTPNSLGQLQQQDLVMGNQNPNGANAFYNSLPSYNIKQGAVVSQSQQHSSLGNPNQSYALSNGPRQPRESEGRQDTGDFLERESLEDLAVIQRQHLKTKMANGEQDKSADSSSLDEEMLSKIKNIYSEMRKHTTSSQYYGGVASVGPIQGNHYSSQNASSGNYNHATSIGQGKIAPGTVGGNGMIQHRLMVRGGAPPQLTSGALHPPGISQQHYGAMSVGLPHNQLQQQIKPPSNSSIDPVSRHTSNNLINPSSNLLQQTHLSSSQVRTTYAGASSQIPVVAQQVGGKLKGGVRG